MSATAFGAPGTPPTWCSSDKDFVTTALGSSRLWATVGHGIINEVYWPSTGQPQVRDISFYLVGDGHWIDLKRVCRYRISTAGPFLPAVTVIHEGDNYQLTLDVLPDPWRDALLIRYDLEGPYRLVAILAPHLGSSGRDNSAWIDAGLGYARSGNFSLCWAPSQPFTRLSCGYVGSSDGWQDLSRNAALTWDFDAAPKGVVALSAELAGSQGVMAVGFSDSPRGGLTLACSALAENFDDARDHFLDHWRRWGTALKLPRPNGRLGDAGLLSATVLKMHEDRNFPGAIVASLSVPWGNNTDTLGGYHLVWPRDATLTAFAFLAANQSHDARHILGHLLATQTDDGRWPQNYFPSGEPFWTGIQVDETAFPVLLAAKRRELGEEDLAGTGRMVRAAIGFIARTGPGSQQDRWEENPGVSSFTLAAAIAALVAAAPWLTAAERTYAEALADDWNERLEGWCYVSGTALAAEHGVAGYYVRLGRAEENTASTELVTLRNREGEQIRANALVSLEFSYLVRLGLRSAKDPRVLDTLVVVDRVLGVETPSGRLYHRYNEDGYGEHADGRPFDGAGIGRGWPLLVGERAHLAMQAGEDPLPYLQTMWNCASAGGLLPEQVWDSAPIPEFGLVPGRPSGSAMPLLWSHAEFLKLLVARDNGGRPIEMLTVVERRYSGTAPVPAESRWRSEAPVLQLVAGRELLVEDREPFTLHFGLGGWSEVHERAAVPAAFGLWSVRLTADEVRDHALVVFTRRYGARWEGRDHAVSVGPAASVHTLQRSG